MRGDSPLHRGCVITRARRPMFVNPAQNYCRHREIRFQSAATIRLFAITVPEAPERSFIQKQQEIGGKILCFNRSNVGFFPMKNFRGKKIYSGWKETLQQTKTPILRGIIAGEAIAKK